MTSFTVLVLCIQACLIQNAFSACVGPAFGGPGLASGLGYGVAGFAGPAGIAGCAGPAYGGNGIGNVAVTGELPVCGTTSLVGQVPIIGNVQFGGPVCAAGTVSIAGSCACGCAGRGIY